MEPPHMTLTAVVDHLRRDRGVTQALEALTQGEPFVDITIAPGARPAFLAALARTPERTGPLVAVTATTRAANDLNDALHAYLPNASITQFPSWETLPHERLSPRSDTVGTRLSVLRRLENPDPDGPHGPIDIVIVPIRSLLQPIATGLANLAPVYLQWGEERSLTDVVDALTSAAYTRTDLVERRGEFAVRGGVLDVFPPTEQHPIRIEFFGDEIEDLRYFKVADQRSFPAVSHAARPAAIKAGMVPAHLWAPPCRELLLTDTVKQRALDLANKLPGITDMVEKISQGIGVEGMESLTPALVDGMETFLDVLHRVGGAHILLLDPEKIRTRAHDLVATSEEFLDASWSSASGGAEAPIDLRGVLNQASYHSLGETRSAADHAGIPWWTLTSFTADPDTATTHPDDNFGDDANTTYLRIDTHETPDYHGDIPKATTDLATWTHENKLVVVTTAGKGLAERLSEVLTNADIPVHTDASGTDNRTGLVHVTKADITEGFIAPSAGIAIVSEADLISGKGRRTTGGTTKDMRKMPSRRRRQVDPLSLKPGDHVVHEQHGVGRFIEMTQRTVQGATREYLLIEYAPSKRGGPADRLFVPTDQLDQVTAYVGNDAPNLNKLGGSDWNKTKTRAKKHVKQIAGELVRLYSARMATKGHAFGPDTPWQRELEDAFAYVETPDQLSSIDEVKDDMEKEIPMDRLISGDVGYGKTELAVRAAFKAIQDGKQVAVLVPTTLLVQQHFQTFTERYAQFPVNVKALSRFQNKKESDETIAGLADGKVDLVIGTHRLLSSTVRFKDLGLVIIDEEQRFGVEHKEQLKAMRTNVDVLAMSATPIPRTLEMAVTGIREMSTLATPPEERHPVLTFVGPYNDKQVAAAIRRELLREGQVFYVHNKVSDIEKVAAHIRELVPEARVETAHGQMGETRLEKVVVDFWEKEFDVLVCTTIVETGLDISNANTLILDRADNFGLSQLHQLRGRVGRGRERAYAYFMYPTGKPLTETAHDRLATIAANTDLGAGMQVAMKDLEMRGAGNLLGGEQAGHIDGVGFDLYVRLVGEAVAEFKTGEMDEAPREVKIELPVDAHIPHNYVAEERLRLEAYKRLAAVTDNAELTALIEEIVDRYGPYPEPVANLIEVAKLRTVAKRAGISDIGIQGNMIRFGPVDLKDSQQLRLTRMYKGTTIKAAVRQILVRRPMTAPIGGTPLKNKEILAWTTELIQQIFLDAPTSR